MARKGVRIHHRHRRDVGAFTWVMGPHQAESAGTADTIRLAREAGIQVCEYTAPGMTGCHASWLPLVKALRRPGGAEMVPNWSQNSDWWNKGKPLPMQVGRGFSMVGLTGFEPATT